MHGRCSGASRVTGGGGGRLVRPREAAGGSVFLHSGFTPANRGRASGELDSMAGGGAKQGEARAARVRRAGAHAI
jgi:hypothetical protein